MERHTTLLLSTLVGLTLTIGGCGKTPKRSAKSKPAPSGDTMAHEPCMSAPIDCPLRSMGADHGHMGHGHMGHGDKHRPFGSVKKYISHLDRSDRDTWQKPEAVIQKLGLKPGAVVADVGAGSGYFALRIAKRYPKVRVIAIDIEPKMLTHIRKRAQELNLSNLTTVRATSSDPKVDSKPDLVLVADVLHHVPNQAAWLERMFKAMKPGARLAIIEFKEGDLPKGPPAHIKIPRAKLVKLLTSAGFIQPVVDAKLLPYQLLVVLQKPTKK